MPRSLVSATSAPPPKPGPPSPSIEVAARVGLAGRGDSLEMDVYTAKALRLVISFRRVISTRAQKMFSQAYNFSSLMPRSISLVCFSLSLEYSCRPSPGQKRVSFAPIPPARKEPSRCPLRRQCPAPVPTGMPPAFSIHPRSQTEKLRPDQ